MKKLIISALFFGVAAAAHAQDSTASRLGLQHTVAATVSLVYPLLTGYYYGAQYDLRFRTPHKTVDWAVGSAFSLTTFDYVYSRVPVQMTSSKGNSQRMILYSSLLLGRKNWTFETGVQAVLSLLDYKYTDKYIYNSTYVRDTTIFKEGNAGSITLGIPLGVRFQPARSAFFASFLVNTNLLYINNWDLSKTGEYKSKSFRFYSEPERISLSLGYTFPVKNKK